jgi:hypothetical protein
MQHVGLHTEKSNFRTDEFNYTFVSRVRNSCIIAMALHYKYLSSGHTVGTTGSYSEDQPPTHPTRPQVKVKPCTKRSILRCMLQTLTQNTTFWPIS